MCVCQIPKYHQLFLFLHLFACLPGVWMQLVLEQFGAIVNNVLNSAEKPLPHWEGIEMSGPLCYEHVFAFTFHYE